MAVGEYRVKRNDQWLIRGYSGTLMEEVEWQKYLRGFLRAMSKSALNDYRGSARTPDSRLRADQTAQR